MTFRVVGDHDSPRFPFRCYLRISMIFPEENWFSNFKIKICFSPSLAGAQGLNNLVFRSVSSRAVVRNEFMPLARLISAKVHAVGSAAVGSASV